MITLYGIKNCDTCRKARKWLNDRGIEHRYHDLREDGMNADLAKVWLEAAGTDTLVNRRGTTWRKLPEDIRDGLDEKSAAKLLLEHPTLIKRPVIDRDGAIIVGFTQEIQDGLAS